MSAPSPEDRDHMDAAACRRLWSAVALTVFSDSWSAIEAGTISREDARGKALRYFRSRDGRTVMALAGVDVDPERLADIAANPAARERTKLHREAE